jgi:serine/threonine-protein kinase SRPK3
LYPRHLISYFACGYQTYSFLSSRLERYVTLKILKANASSNSREHSILLHLSQGDTRHPGKTHVLQLLDQFEHKGPNGLHLCLVFPVMISDGEAMTVRGKPRCPGYVREISKQILLGLNYLHDQGLIHGGIYTRDRCTR